MPNRSGKALKLLSFFRIWNILVLFTIPIAYRTLPSFGVWIHEVMLPINRQLSLAIFNVNINETYWISDSAGFYTMGVILFFVALAITILKPVWNYLKSKVNAIHNHQTSPFVIDSTIILNYTLAYFLLRYGFDKIISNQFYFPAPNTLHTEIGNLSKDILYWSTMGTSTSYNYFMASLEILAGLFLIIRRTRFLGTLMAFGIMLNVFATNIGFDISVKYLSGWLLLASLILLIGFSAQLKTLIGFDYSKKACIQEKRTISNILLKSVVIIFLIVEISLPAFVGGEYPFESKSYTVLNVKGKSNQLSLHKMKRIHIHREGYLIIEDENQQFESHPILPIHNGFHVKKMKISVAKTKNTISWIEDDSKIEIYIQEINLKTLALAQDNQHWFVEDMLK